MRDVLRLSLTLALITVLSATLLTGMHGVTEPIIDERRERDLYETMEEFFPGIEDFEEKERNGNKFNVIYDQAGEKLGVCATIETSGYEEGLIYNLAVDDEGEIVGINIVTHSETPGIGDVITTDQFQEQFIGKGFEDSLAAGEDVDTVSGATLSSNGMISSIRRSITTIGEEFLDLEKETIELAEIPDGVYEGSVEGQEGTLTVEVEIADGRIERVDVIEQHETEEYYDKSYPEIPNRIVENQSLEVDTQTGATLTAERIISAVEKALLETGEENDNGGDNNNEGE
ncbi:MAG: FMN-binding protein [Bacillota bacterium]